MDVSYIVSKMRELYFLGWLHAESRYICAS